MGVDLAWMPAHTCAADVGELDLSNGRRLSSVDRDSNAEADRLAKAAAAESRVPEACRDMVVQAIERVTEQARWIGRVTHLASSFFGG